MRRSICWLPLDSQVEAVKSNSAALVLYRIDFTMTVARTALLTGQQLSHATKRIGTNVRLTSALKKNVSCLSSMRFLSSASAGDTLRSLAIESPHVEAVRYEHKNVKWTMKHVDYHSDSLAIGLLENGLAPGDTVLSWLPLHFGEQVRKDEMKSIVLACSSYIHPAPSILSFKAHITICMF